MSFFRLRNKYQLFRHICNYWWQDNEHYVNCLAKQKTSGMDKIIILHQTHSQIPAHLPAHVSTHSQHRRNLIF